MWKIKRVLRRYIKYKWILGILMLHFGIVFMTQTGLQKSFLDSLIIVDKIFGTFILSMAGIFLLVWSFTPSNKNDDGGEGGDFYC